MTFKATLSLTVLLSPVRAFPLPLATLSVTVCSLATEEVSLGNVQTKLFNKVRLMWFRQQQK